MKFNTALLLPALMSSVVLISSSCASTSSKPLPVTDQSIAAGTSVKMGPNELKLYPGELKVGDNMSESLALLGHKVEGVTVVNIVPSVDTKVCEEQTHILGETKNLDPKVTRITISRDLPFAQKRFAEQAKLENINYLSDYKTGAFGKKTGLLIRDVELLTRGVIVLDKEGVIKHIQLVPQVAELPNMEKAFSVANNLGANQ